MKSATMLRYVMHDLEWACDETPYKVIPVVSHDAVEGIVRVWLRGPKGEIAFDTHYEYSDTNEDIAWCVINTIEEFLFEHKLLPARRFTL